MPVADGNGPTGSTALVLELAKVNAVIEVVHDSLTEATGMDPNEVAPYDMVTELVSQRDTFKRLWREWEDCNDDEPCPAHRTLTARLTELDSAASAVVEHWASGGNDPGGFVIKMRRLKGALSEQYDGRQALMESTTDGNGTRASNLALLVVARALASGGPIEDELDAAAAVLEALGEEGFHLVSPPPRRTPPLPEEMVWRNPLPVTWGSGGSAVSDASRPEGET